MENKHKLMIAGALALVVLVVVLVLVLRKKKKVLRLWNLNPSERLGTKAVAQNFLANRIPDARMATMNDVVGYYSRNQNVQPACIYSWLLDADGPVLAVNNATAPGPACGAGSLPAGQRPASLMLPVDSSGNAPAGGVVGVWFWSYEELPASGPLGGARWIY